MTSKKNKKIRIALKHIAEDGETDYFSLYDWGDIVKEKVIELFKDAGSHAILIQRHSLAQLIRENPSFKKRYDLKMRVTSYKVVDEK